MTHTTTPSTGSLSRRGFLTGSLGAATLLGVGACSDKHSGDGAAGDTPAAPAASSGAKSSSGPVTGKLTFAFWGGSPGETAGFTSAKKKFEAANPGAEVQLKIVPYDGFFSGIDRGITAGNAPDLFRVDYTTIGKYSSKGVLLDLSPYVSEQEAGAFLPALWDAVKFNDTPYGVPHQTDTTCIIYNKKALETAGITAVPDKLEDAWTWEEFSDVATKLRASLPANKFPFAYDWTQAGAFRWLSWLYQAGGTLLTEDRKKSALPSEPATTAMEFTKSFFEKSWVPRTNTIKTSVYSDNFFLNQTVAMSFVGDFLVPSIADAKAGYKGGEWAATYMPQSKAAASDLGGNAIVALKTVKNPDLAAAFLKFLVTEENMKYFCEQAIELPTLQSLASENLKYASRPDVVAVCAQQAKTISDTVVREATVPAFASINTVLQDQLEQGFRSQSAEATIKNIARGVDNALAG